MKKYKLAILFAFVIFETLAKNGFSEPSFIQKAESTYKLKDQNELKTKLEIELNSFKSSGKVKEAFNDYLVASLKHRKETFDWQLTASKIIFGVVVLVVIMGLSISFLQFYNSTYSIKRRGTQVANDTELEIKLEGIKIKSSLVGLLILTVSIAFFYLYIHYVFPIKEINLDQKAQEEVIK